MLIPPVFIHIAFLATLGIPSGKTDTVFITPQALNILHIKQAAPYVYVFSPFYIYTLSPTALMEMNLMNMHDIPELSVVSLLLPVLGLVSLIL